MSKATRILLPEAEVRENAQRKLFIRPGDCRTTDRKRKVTPSPWADSGMYSISDFYVSFRTERSGVRNLRHLANWAG